MPHIGAQKGEFGVEILFGFIPLQQAVNCESVAKVMNSRPVCGLLNTDGGKNFNEKTVCVVVFQWISAHVDKHR